MEVRVRKNKSGHQRFGFPCAEVELTDDVVKRAGLAKALGKLGKVLCKQLKIPAVRFHSIKFAQFLE